MYILPSQLREDFKHQFKSLKSLYGEFVECLDDKYLCPNTDELKIIVDKVWPEITALPWISNISDCDNRAALLYADVHRFRMKMASAGMLQQDELIQWAFGIGSGFNPNDQPHSFNVVRCKEGIFVVDNGQILSTSDYEPLSVRF